MALAAQKQFTSVEDALASLFGSGTKIQRTERAAGGDINEACRLTLTDGRHVFMKSNAEENASFFSAEADGLAAIAQTGAVAVPKVFCIGTDSRRSCSFLLMEYIESKSRTADYWETFAHQLAAMHQAGTAAFCAKGKYGFAGNNYIGARAQVNTGHDSWTAFFRECRLEPQFRHAARFFDRGDVRKIDRLLDHLDDFLVEPKQPSLLHGDLWSGNVITGNDGRAWLIDPAVYVGHAEADIAMTELFGGFSRTFYDAYRETGLLQPGYDRRRDLYNLYQLLNHLNMFGRTYLSPVKRIVAQYVS